ncbi:MAG: hypothetical protein CMK59_03675 [Proteobacteria bacterium]|nr:hypothetical protein [Pseudomonadota bacterium]
MLSWLYKALFKPHPYLIDPYDRRVATLLSIHHFLTLPIGPGIYFLRNYTQPGGISLSLWWPVGVFLGALFNYLLARSQWYKVSIYFQIVIALLIPILTMLLIPDRQSVHFAMVVPIMMAGLLMPMKELYATALIALSLFGGVALLTEEQYRPLMMGSFSVMIVLVLLLLLIRHHHSWVEGLRIQRITKQNQQYFKLIDSTFDGTAKLRDNTFSEFKPGFADIFELSEDDLLGQPLTYILPNIEPKNNTLLKTTVTTPSGKKLFLELLFEEGEDQSILVGVRNTTQATLEEAHKLQMDRMSITGTIASSLSHELNTPLMIAMNQTQLGIESLKQNATDEALTRLEGTQDMLERISRITRDLKWFVQLSDEHQTLSPQAVIEQTVRLANHRIGHSCSINTNIKDNPSIEISENHLSQILINLLFNAAEAKSNAEDKVCIDITLETKDEHLVIQVSDNGIGIPTELKDKIFEPFFTANKMEGTGLGLAICHSLLERAGGTIKVEPSQRQGACFVLHIPLLQTPFQPIQNPNLNSKEQLQVLIVDDKPELSLVLCEMLDQFNTQQSSSIGQALKLIEQTHFDLIVCDVIMPNGGAVDLLNALQNQKHHLAEHFIFMTGGAISLDLQSYLQQTSLPVLFKPFKRTELIEAINSIRTREIA